MFIGVGDCGRHALKLTVLIKIKFSMRNRSQKELTKEIHVEKGHTQTWVRYAQRNVCKSK